MTRLSNGNIDSVLFSYYDKYLGGQDTYVLTTI